MKERAQSTHLSRPANAKIRFARRGDFEPLLRLVAAYYKFDSISFDKRSTGRALRELLGDDSLGRVWVIERGSTLIGYAIMAYNHDLEFGGLAGLVTDFYIAARARGQGLGARMMTAIVDFSRGRKIGTIELQVTHGNRVAMKFYRAMGFARLDRTVMSLDLG